jgi:hypothetical protein
MRNSSRPERVLSSLSGPFSKGSNGGNPRQDWGWSGRRESNPHHQLGRLELYH